ncbi:class I SAM-dependent methyltransferase [Kibdelosporangium aridum]|nr:class I SAM-dependent methyltransferase [Kibdelosporangium aridum]
MSTIDWGTGSYERVAPQLLPAAHAAIAAADPRPGQRVVDVGCGTGNAALLAAQRPGVRVTGVDPARRLLELGRAKAVAEGRDVTFVSGHAGSMPLPDGCADVVLSVFAVIFAPDAAASAAELARITAPDGKIVLTAWLPEGAGVEAMRLIIGEVGRITGQTSDMPFQWHERDQVQELFGTYGFDVTVQQHSLAFTAESPEDYWDLSYADHPLVLSIKPLLEEHGVMDDVRNRIIEVFRAANEDPAAFRLTWPYVVISAQR